MAEKVRIAVIGGGRIAELGHLPGFQLAGAEVVALCDRNEQAANSLADTFHIKRRCTDWRQLLDEGGFDAVSICTPPALHCEMVTASAQHGYHTLVEKPMALSLAQCDAMIQAAREAGVLLMIAHNQRFSPRHIVAREVLAEGKLGRPRRAHAAFTHGGPENWSPTQTWYFDTRQAGFGSFVDLGYHKIDLLRWLLGQEVADIQAFGATFEKPTNADDTTVAVLRFSGGTLGTLQISWASRPGVEDLVVIGCEHGLLHVPSSGAEPVHVARQLPSGEIIETTHLNQAAALDTPGWFGMAAAFVDAVKSGKPSPVPGEEGRATLAAVLRAYETMNWATENVDTGLAAAHSIKEQK